MLIPVFHNSLQRLYNMYIEMVAHIQANHHKVASFSSYIESIVLMHLL